MGTPLTPIELEILRQADEHNGTLELDLSDPLHYQYYVESFGGEERLKESTPTFYEMIQFRRNYDTNPEAFSDLKLFDSEVALKLQDYAIIDNTRIDTYEVKRAERCSTLNGNEAECYNEITSTFRAGCSAAMLEANVGVIDMQRGEYIQRYTTTLVPDKDHIFTCDISVPIEEEHINREHPYCTKVTLASLCVTQDNGCLLLPSFVSSIAYSKSTNDDIGEINLIDPRILHADKRSDKKDVICISYNRDGVMQNPDYTFYEGATPEKMPVHLNFSLTIALRNGAYFKADQEGSYFYQKRDPDIHLSRFDDEQQKSISEGRAWLYQDWESFMQHHVDVVETDANHHATKLKLTFPSAWDSNLKMDSVWKNYTYADFYAMLSFNTRNKSSKGDYVDQVTTVFVRQQADPNKRSNPTKPGENTVHVPRLYYQWGCLGKDTVLCGENGPVPACSVKLHDRLVSRNGRIIEVEDIYSGDEETILHIVHEKGDILLTPDHTLFDENLAPLTAEEVSDGSRLLYFNPETMEEEPVTVIKTEMIPYGDKVYNFQFSQPEYLIANGLLAGDHGWQQKIRPGLKTARPIPFNPMIQAAMNELELLNGAPEDLNAQTPVFSNQPECMPLHYFALKTLACCNDLYTQEEAQMIAEYCQYIGDNASIGAMTVKKVPEAVNKDKLAKLVVIKGAAYYMVPIIPTAMVKWYDDDELANPRTWNSSQSKYLKRKPIEYSYQIPQDILAPFHYPFCTQQSPDGTEYFSKEMRKLMNQVVQHAAKQEKLDRNTLMAMGIVLHMFLDGLMHEGFYPSPDWRNLGRIEQVINPQGDDITSQHKPYNPDGKPFPIEEYSDKTVYPAGIKENGDASQCSDVRYCYRFPMDKGELGLGPAAYGGYQNYENTSRYVRGCKQMLKFLVDCKQASGARFDETWWTKIMAPVFEKMFHQTAKSEDAMKKIWKAEFADIAYEYDKQKVAERMFTGDKSKPDDKERYAEFFEFTVLTNRIKKGADLFE